MNKTIHITRLALLFIRTLLVTLWIFLTVVACTYFFHDFLDPLPSELPRHRPPIAAKLKLKRNEIFVRENGSLVWKKIREGQALSLGSYIQCPEDSEAEISFPDGSSIFLAGNSQIHFIGIGAVRLHYGKISKEDTQNASHIALIAGETRFIPSTSARWLFSIDKDVSGTGLFTIYEGNAQIETGGVQQQAQAGEEVFFSDTSSNLPPIIRKSDSESSKLDLARQLSLHEDIPPHLLLPLDNSRATRSGFVEFAWSSVENAMGYDLKIEPIDLEIHTDRIYAKINSIDSGNYTWRVRAKLRNGKSTRWSERRRLMVNS